jgi:hypothetical protein
MNAVKRLQMSDHGPTHFQIVANIGLKILRNLLDAGVKPTIVTDYGLQAEDAEVVVFLGCILHDLGISVHRDNHHLFSVPLAAQVLPRLLEGVYEERERTIISTEVLHTVYAHEAGIRVLTVEAGIVRVADALDMKEGRARIPFEHGKVDIHSLSAMSIREVRISETPEKPVVIEIKMRNESGIFQVDHLLRSKLAGSGLERYIQVVAQVEEPEGPRVLTKYELGPLAPI